MVKTNIKDTLIDRTISVIASNGLDKTTTKSIASGTGINEVYIYRQFSNKDDLLEKTFEKLDRELSMKALQHVSVMYFKDMEYETRCRLFFKSIWDFMISNREKCLAYIQYYYSPYFIRYSKDSHLKMYEPLVEKFNDAFKKETKVWYVLNHCLNVMLNFALMVHTDQMPNDDDYSEHVFRVIYASVKQYFKNNKESYL